MDDVLLYQRAYASLIDKWLDEHLPESPEKELVRFIVAKRHAAPAQKPATLEAAAPAAIAAAPKTAPRRPADPTEEIRRLVVDALDSRAEMPRARIAELTGLDARGVQALIDKAVLSHMQAKHIDRYMEIASAPIVAQKRKSRASGLSEAGKAALAAGRKRYWDNKRAEKAGTA